MLVLLGGGTAKVVRADEALEEPATTEEPEAVEEPEAAEEPEATEEPVAQKSQNISLKVSKKTYTADQFRTGKKTFKIGASAKTKITYKVTSGSKYVSVNQSGLVTIKRWTPKGNYKISVTAKATEEYKEAAKTVTVTVKKASAAVMSKVKINWDLKNNKTVKYSSAYGIYLAPKLSNRSKTGPIDTIHGKISNLFKKGSIQVKNFKKVKTAGGKKYKVTCTLRFIQPTNFSKTEINQIGDFGGLTNYWGMNISGFIVDYQTGENLERKNSYGVSAKLGKWKHIGTNKYVLSDGWWSDPKISEVKVTVTYPKEYKDLCILAGGNSNRSKCDGQADSFDDSDINFKQATAWYSKKDKLVCHGIRVK